MNVEQEDNIFMKRCIELAGLAIGNTAPNPMVGSVIVHKGKIIGEGYHRLCGEPHAEVNAIHSVKDKSLLKESTLYVNLEPCSHHGKTPPCADLIVSMGIPRVVVGMVDINPDVSGRGILKLEAAGIKVTLGVLEKESIFLNKRFITFFEKKRPYVVLKWAQTLDGFIDVRRKEGTPQRPTWINTPRELALVHKWRSEEQAIMVGTNTAERDNPSLTTRLWKGKNPLRVVIDRTLRLDRSLSLFDHQTPTLVITAMKHADEENLSFVQLAFDQHLLKNILDELYNRKIQSILVEGGEQLLKSFIHDNLWDEARVFVAENNFHEGTHAPVFKGKMLSAEKMEKTRLYYYINPNQLIEIPA